MKSFSLLCLLMVPFLCAAQTVEPADNGPFTYTGPRIVLDEHPFSARRIAPLQGAEKQSYQGMDAWGEWVVSLQNTGLLTLYRYDGRTLRRQGAPFATAHHDAENHANVASFGPDRLAGDDELPLLYVSQCSRGRYKGMKDVAFVERIRPDLRTAEAVQTILYQDEKQHFGYALQWVVDRENRFLYGYGNTVNNTDPSNRHRIVKFRLPEVGDTLVVLTDNDLLENYLVEDTYACPFNPIGQGLFIHHGLLFMPTGLGTEAQPSVLYVWNLAERRMQNVIDLSQATEGELEDCGLFGNKLLLQSQGALYELQFQ